MYRLILGVGFIYIITSLALLRFTWVEKEESRIVYDKNLLKNYNTIFQSITHINKKRAQYIYDTQIAVPKILNLFKNFYTKSDKEKDIVRKKLYAKLNPLYKIMQTYHFNQFHFHLKNNTSFLRMHKPAKYGDDLTKARSTVVYVNNYHKSITGFEEGKIYSSWRYVYPLIVESEYIGSVEVSFSILDIIKEMERYNIKNIEFIIDNNIVQKKVFDSEQNNYIQSPYKGYLYDKEILNAFPITDDYTTVGFDKKLVHIHKDNKNIVRFPIPLTNPVTKKEVGYIIITVDDHFIMSKNYTINLLAGFILLSIIFIFIIIIRRLKIEKTLQEQEIHLQQIAHEKEQQENIAKTKDSFLLLFSHELKTPLNAIINFSKYLSKHQDNLQQLPKSKIAKLLNGIEVSANLMLLNVMQILNFNELKEGKLTFNLKNVIVGNLIQDIIEKNKPFQEQYNIEIEYVNECSNRTINTDKKYFEQIISAILLNAIKSAKKKVLIVHTCKEDSWRLLIEYDDEEIKNQEEILKLFSHSDKQLLQNKQNGIGIGLNFAKLLCDALKISFQVQNSKTLNGISFELTKLI